VRIARLRIGNVTLKTFIRYNNSDKQKYRKIIQRVHEKTPPKYNGLVFEILGKHH